jgi:hypothetical protein
VLTLLHETARRSGLPGAPRMDVMGMRAIALALRKLDQTPPPRDTLFDLAFLGDLVSNSAYYSLVGVSNDAPQRTWTRGALLGFAAGVGAAYLPPRIGLGEQPGQRPPATQIMTVAWYLAGGLAAAAAAGHLGSGDDGVPTGPPTRV